MAEVIPILHFGTVVVSATITLGYDFLSPHRESDVSDFVVRAEDVIIVNKDETESGAATFQLYVLLNVQTQVLDVEALLEALEVCIHVN